MPSLQELLSEDFETMHADTANYGAILAQLKKTSPSMFRALAPLVSKVVAMEQNGGRMAPGKDSTVSSAGEARSLIAASVGDMYIQVKRTTNTVVDTNDNPVALPVCLFGLNDYDNGYKTIMGPQLQILNNQVGNNGVVLALAKVNGNVTFTYTQGNHSDVLTVSFIGGVTAYTNVLNAQNQEDVKWGTRLILYTISDPTNGLAQIQDGFLAFNNVGTSSASNNNLISIDSRKLEDVFQDDRVSMIFPEQNFDATRGLVDTIIPVPSEDSYFQVKYNIFQSWKGRRK